MKPKRLLWQLFPTYLLITLLSLIAVSWYASRSIRTLYLSHVSESLEFRTETIRRDIAEILTKPNRGKLQALCVQMGSQIAARITIILPDGKVAADTNENPAVMENHANRPEFIEAIQLDKATSKRYSKTLREKMMYLAMPVLQDGRALAVVRTAIPITEIDQVLRTIYRKLIIAGAIVAFFSAGLSLWVSRRISRPIVMMNLAAERFAQEELESRVPEPDSAELAALARSLNTMAAQLHNRIQTITQQRNEFEAVLLSMVEGVWAIDAEGKTLNMNHAAAQLLNVRPEKVFGLTVPEIVRHPELQRFIDETLQSDLPTETDIYVPDTGRYLQLHAAGLREAGQPRRGAVIVFNDVTHLRKLESLRRDFVANVSHELKTPITSLKGFVETLLDGAMNGPEQTRRFLDIIAKQADRLHALVEDLLSLTRIEEDSEKGRVTFHKTELKPLLEQAISLTQYASGPKKLTVRLECPDGLTAAINVPFMEQAVVNLIDNAIKYSESEKDILVAATRSENDILISVRDQGKGIAAEHLDRIFERFYVIDKARSKKVGGTGLGLAIVKHAAQAHHGHVTVESRPAAGSTFTIHLPNQVLES